MGTHKVDNVVDGAGTGPTNFPNGLTIAGGGTLQQFTNWGAVSPSFAGLGTPSQSEFYGRLVGKSLEMHGQVTAGTVDGSIAALIMPAGIVIDGGKISSGGANIPLGVGFRMEAGNLWASVGLVPVLFFDPGNTDRLFFAVTTDTGAFHKAAANTMFSSGARVTIKLWGVPVQ